MLKTHKRVVLVVGEHHDTFEHHLIQAQLLNAFHAAGTPTTLATEKAINYTMRYLRTLGYDEDTAARILERIDDADSMGHVRAHGIIAEGAYEKDKWLPLVAAIQNNQRIMLVDAAIPTQGTFRDLPLDNARTIAAMHRLALRGPVNPLLSDGVYLRNRLMLDSARDRLASVRDEFHVVMMSVGGAHVAGEQRPFADMGMAPLPGMPGEKPYAQSLMGLCERENIPAIGIMLGNFDAYPDEKARSRVTNVSDSIDTKLAAAELNWAAYFEPAMQDNARHLFSLAVSAAQTPLPAPAAAPRRSRWPSWLPRLHG